MPCINVAAPVAAGPAAAPSQIPPNTTHPQRAAPRSPASTGKGGRFSPVLSVVDTEDYALAAQYQAGSDDGSMDPLQDSRPHIPRPLNSFMVFSKYFRKRLRVSHPDVDNKGISRMLGETWQSLPPEQMQYYAKEADRLAVEHRALYPEYKFVRQGSAKRIRRSSGATAALPIAPRLLLHPTTLLTDSVIRSTYQPDFDPRPRVRIMHQYPVHMPVPHYPQPLLVFAHDNPRPDGDPAQGVPAGASNMHLLQPERQHRLQLQQQALQCEQDELLTQMTRPRAADGPAVPVRHLQALAWRRATAYLQPAPDYAAVMRARQRLMQTTTCSRLFIWPCVIRWIACSSHAWRASTPARTSVSSRRIRAGLLCAARVSCCCATAVPQPRSAAMNACTPLSCSAATTARRHAELARGTTRLLDPAWPPLRAAALDLPAPQAPSTESARPSAAKTRPETAASARCDRQNACKTHASALPWYLAAARRGSCWNSCTAAMKVGSAAASLTCHSCQGPRTLEPPQQRRPLRQLLQQCVVHPLALRPLDKRARRPHSLLHLRQLRRVRPSTQQAEQTTPLRSSGALGRIISRGSVRAAGTEAGGFSLPLPSRKPFLSRGRGGCHHENAI